MRTSRTILIEAVSHRSVLRESLRDPEGFWGKQADAITWDKKPDKILDRGDLIDTWFPGGKLNLCYNAVDVHVDNGNGENVALRYV